MANSPRLVAVLSRVVRAHIIPEADLVLSWGMGPWAAPALDGLVKRELVCRREEVSQFIGQEGFPSKPGPWIVPTEAGTTRMTEELDIGFPPSGNWLVLAGVPLNHQPPDLLIQLTEYFSVLNGNIKVDEEGTCDPPPFCWGICSRGSARSKRPMTESVKGIDEASRASFVARQTQMECSGVLVSAGACTEALLADVEAYVQAGIAPATKRAYRADIDHFRAWGGTIPAIEAQVAAYLADRAAVLKVSTLTRRLAAVSIAHDARDPPNPVRTPLVRATMRGIRREHGAAQHQAKRLFREDLFVVLGAMGDRLKDLRDRALLLLGFAGGLRRSELTAINFIEFERFPPRSFTKQYGSISGSASACATSKICWRNAAWRCPTRRFGVG